MVTGIHNVLMGEKRDSFVTNQILEYFKSFAFLSRLDGH